MRAYKFGLTSIIVVFLILSIGCASQSLMPKYSEVPVTSNKYSVVIQFYNNIKIGMTLNDVKTVTGVDLNNGQDITILGPTYIRNFFMKDSFIRIDYLPDEVQKCIRNNKCVGYIMSKHVISSNGIGKFMPRWLRFKRKDLIKEWKLKILILASNDKITYKEILYALPEQVKIKTKRQPLGPLQNVFGDAQYRYKF